MRRAAEVVPIVATGGCNLGWERSDRIRYGWAEADFLRPATIGRESRLVRLRRTFAEGERIDHPPCEEHRELAMM
jgi:hypothetical protein